MTLESTPLHSTPLATSLSRFLRDLASFAGRKGIITSIWVLFGAVLEALSLAVLVPLLSFAIGSGMPFGRLGNIARTMFRFTGVEQPLGRLALLLGVFGVLIIVRAFVLSTRDVSIAELQVGFVEARRLRIAQILVAAQWEQIVRLRHARIMNLIGGEIQRIADMTELLLRSAVMTVMLIAQFILVLLLTPLFASLALGLLVIGIFLFLPIARRAHASGGLMTSANLSLSDSTAQFLSGLKLAMSQNLQTHFITEFKQSLDELTQRQIDYSRQLSHVRNSLTTLSALAAALLIFIGFSVFHLATAALITLVVIISRMINPIGQIQQNVQRFVHYLPSYEKVREFEQEFTTIAQRKSMQAARLPPPPKGPIVFENVSYRYAIDDGDSGSIRGVQGVSLTIRPGEFLGITGPSGAGKTTFADLLVGLILPEQGRITVAGTPLKDALLASWRDNVSYISQDPFLFHDTVRHNITWANPQANDKETLGRPRVSRR